MRDTPIPAHPQVNSQPNPTPDADFTRHKQALAAQITLTHAEILKPTTDTLSHW